MSSGYDGRVLEACWAIGESRMVAKEMATVLTYLFAIITFRALSYVPDILLSWL